MTTDNVPGDGESPQGVATGDAAQPSDIDILLAGTLGLLSEESDNGALRNALTAFAEGARVAH